VLARELGAFDTFTELRHSSIFHDRLRYLTSLLSEPRVYKNETAAPRLKSFIRVAAWNIERGTRLAGIIDALNSHPVLRYADILLLSELDVGMARSGNVDVPLVLAKELGAHAIFAAEYLELTTGTAANAPSGSNCEALHGNAIITRHPFNKPVVVRLPRCENNFESVERRIGGRLALVSDINVAGTIVVAATTHLDVVNTPACRRLQLQSALQAIEDRTNKRSLNDRPRVILGGDLNTHTFARGGRLRAMKNTIAILGSSPARLRRRLSEPHRREKALTEFKRFGYELDALTDGKPTSRSTVSSLDDAVGLPWPISWWVRRRVGLEGLSLDLRLDWLAQKGMRVLQQGELVDAGTAAASVSAHTVCDPGYDSLSDHLPVVADLVVR